MTTDIIFPLDLLSFLFPFARFTAERLGGLRALSTLLPVTSFVFDVMENLSIVALLTDYPAQNDLIASRLGLVTRARHFSLDLSILVPATLLTYTTCKRYFSR